MKKNYLTYFLTSLMLISGCNTNVSSTSSNVNNKTSSEVIIKSPNEDGGLEGNQEDDKVEKQDSEVLKTFLTKCAKVKIRNDCQ